LLVLLFYALTRPGPGKTRRTELKTRAQGLATTAATAALVALPQLAYTVPYLNRAYRFTGGAAPTPPGGAVSFKQFSQLYSGGPDSVLSLLDPQRYPVPDGNELYIGLAALAVLLASVLSLRRAVSAQLGRYSPPLVAAAVGGALAMLGPWTVFPRLLYALPFFAQIRQLARYSIMVHLVLCLLLAFALHAIGVGWRRQGMARSGPREQIAAAVGAFVVIDGIYLIVERAPGSDAWFGAQTLLGGLALLILAAAGARAVKLPLAPLLGLLIVGASLHNGIRTLGATSSPLYPPRYFARTPAITYAESACSGHRTLLVDDALPRNIGDVFRRIRTQNGYGATLHVPFFDFISASSWTSREQTRLLDLRCIIARSPLTLDGYHVGFRDPARGVTVYVDDHTSPVNTPELQPIPATVLKDDDRHKRWIVTLPRRTTVVVSAIVYPGWHVEVDGQRPSTSSFRVSTVPVFPEFTIGPGRHTVDYSWSGWPA
jgi:hypothetical protein